MNILIWSSRSKRSRPVIMHWEEVESYLVRSEDGRLHPSNSADTGRCGKLIRLLTGSSINEARLLGASASCSRRNPSSCIFCRLSSISDSRSLLRRTNLRVLSINDLERVWCHVQPSLTELPPPDSESVKPKLVSLPSAFVHLLNTLFMLSDCR